MNYAILAFIVIVLVILVAANGSLPSYLTNQNDQTVFVMFIVVIAAIGAWYGLGGRR